MLYCLVLKVILHMIWILLFSQLLFITLRLGRPSTVLITAGSSNIWHLPSPPLCPLNLPRCPGGNRGRYCGLRLGGEWELRRGDGLGSVGGGGVGDGGRGGGGSLNSSRLLLGSSVVPCASKSTTDACRKQFEGSFHL